MNPVTELWNVAHELGQTCDMHTGLERRLADALDAIQKRGLLALLDLVATLPPERLGLVRWAAGLSNEQLGEVQGLLEMGTAEAKKRGYPDWGKGFAYGAEFMRAALSGGEGGAKEEACDQPGECPDAGCDACRQAEERQPQHPMWNAVADAVAEPEPATEDEIRDLETRLAEVRARIRSYDGGDRPSSPPAAMLREEAELSMQLHSLTDELDQARRKPSLLPVGKPATHTSTCVDGCACRAADATGKPDCPTCPWGMPIYGAHWRVVSGRVWCRHQYEYDRLLGLAAKAQKTETRVLEAGKPPPFLRVGMRLRSSLGEIWRVEAMHDVQIITVTRPGRGPYAIREDELSHWTLEEPFTVEGES